MPVAGDMTIRLTADTTLTEDVLRIIAKHATACADELAALRAKDH